MTKRSTEAIGTVVGMDLGDRYCQLYILDADGQPAGQPRVATREPDLRRWFSGQGRLRVAMEVGTHSPWISRVLASLGHEVIVANPRRLRLLYENRRKDDRVDAEYLARLARVDPALLHPIQHREEQTQADLAVIRARGELVAARSGLINTCRGMAKSLGIRLPSSSSEYFARKVEGAIPEPLLSALEPLRVTIAELTQRIRDFDRQIEQIARDRYPQTKLLESVHGVGTLTALTFVLVIEDPCRFAKSRDVGAYLGLVPARSDSGERQRSLSITKEGDCYLRTLLTQCAHYILGPFGRDCELRRFGQRLAQGGGSAGKRRAVTAVARKLACLLHHLWRTGEVYEPWHHSAPPVAVPA